MDGKRLIAICDTDILGKRFEEGKLQLDLTSQFYKGEEMDEQAAKKLLAGASHLNATGKKAVQLCVGLGFVAKAHVITIAGVPHAEAEIAEE